MLRSRRFAYFISVVLYTVNTTDVLRFFVMISVSSIHWGSKTNKDDCAVQIFLEALAEVVLCLGYVCKCARVCMVLYSVCVFSCLLCGKRV